MHESELFDAIRRNDAETVAALLDADPSLSCARQNGVTPVLFAAYNGHPELAQLFAGRVAAITFGEACALGDLERVRAMLEDDPSLLDGYTEDGFPALGLAIFFRHPEVARELIEGGADVNAAARNALRVAPLHAAAAVRDHATVALLLARGADADARQQLGYTALHTAAQHGDAMLVGLLLNAGADASIAGDDGKTPADLAAEQKHLAVVDRLKRQ